MDEIQMQPVVSSNVKAIGFDDKTNTLRVQFNSGGMYDAVTTKTDYDTFMAAKSKGQHFQKVLKKAFTWNKAIEKKS